MIDFTLRTYIQLLTKLKEKDYTFLTFKQYMSKSHDKSPRRLKNGEILNLNSNISKLNNHHNQNNQEFEITHHQPPTSTQRLCLLRHDVDRLPGNALQTAKIENKMGIRGSYYFRIVPQSFDEKIIRQIAELGHEIGYHYEDVHLAWRNRKCEVGSRQSSNRINEFIVDLAYESFCKNLDKLRQIAEIKTICMHGSPLSKFDNKLLWTKYDYRNLGIIGEPYLDINWSEFGYLTDTGRRWDGVAIRDKVKSVNEKLKNKFKKTHDIINNIAELPDKLMITVHPERWTDNWFLWSKQLVWQKLKNSVKRIYMFRDPVKKILNNVK